MRKTKGMGIMKKWKKWLAAGLTAAAISVGSLGMTVAVEAAGYERWDTVAEEERVQAGYTESKDKDDDKDDDKDEPEKIHPYAWKQINGVCYNGSGKPIPGAITWGMDVSEWQGKINWYKVKECGIDFAFVRIAYGRNYMDKTYDYNMEQAEEAGVPVGTYVYSLATTPGEALKEAKMAIEKMKGYKVSYPVVYDLEYSKMGELTKKQVSKLAETFCEEVKKAGYYPMVYCNTNWYDYEVDWTALPDYDVWIARYGDKIQAPSKSDYSYTIWQSTDGDGGGVLNPTKGLIAGVPANCNVDVDFGYVDYTKKIVPRRNPVSGYVPSPDIEEDKEEKPLEDIGKKGTWKEVSGKKYFYVNGKK